jgi:hypothetical protein
MRLLTAGTLQFFEPKEDVSTEYAILSHRWECDDEEVSYQDMCKVIQAGNLQPEAGSIQKRRGFRKIYDFSRQALRDGYKYIWIDTCCIDKSSSAELQEAINSMYQWYANSAVCYAYLSDVSMPNHDVNKVGRRLPETACISSFQASEWFTRGWTLQELLASQNVVFFDTNWKRCGTASDLNVLIQTVAGIDIRGFAKGIGQDRAKLWTIRVGRRMAWASNRQTKRIEDRAYSLLGLFDVNMPMLYGESERAFQRLQEEIIKTEEDASILAWSYLDTDTEFASNGLATSPAHFQKYLDLVKRVDKSYVFAPFSPVMTPRGLQATMKIWRDPNDHALGYAVLMETKGKYSKRFESLLLPIMFPNITFLRSGMRNECVRFADPLWAPSKFIKGAKLKPVCFIRHIQTAGVYCDTNGFSLSLRVWRRYVACFTYPVQTQPGRRHFPAIFGAFSKSSGKKKDMDRTFILELAARPQAVQRFAVLVDYKVKNGRIDKSPIVRAIRLQRPMDLEFAAKLARPGNSRRGLVCCTLSDCKGSEIPVDEIIYVNNFHGYWTHARDNDFNNLPDRPVKKVASKTLGAMIQGDIL